MYSHGLTAGGVRREVVVASMAMYTDLGVLIEDPPTLYPFNIRPPSCPVRARIPDDAACILLIETIEYQRSRSDLTTLQMYGALVGLLGALEARPVARLDLPSGESATVYERGPSGRTIEYQRRLALVAMQTAEQKVTWSALIRRSPAFRAYKEVHGYQTDKLAFKYLLQDVKPMLKAIDGVLEARAKRSEAAYQQRLRDDRDKRREERQAGPKRGISCPGCP